MIKKAKVLAVDDEPTNLNIMRIYLSKAGYTTVLAEDGRMALQRLEENPDIDVILLDRMMPHMDGMTCLSEIKSNTKWRDIPVVMQTAAAATEQVLQGINAGVYYYLTKPYDDRMLLSIVRSALSDAKIRKNMREEVSRQRSVLGLMELSVFRFRTMNEAKTLAFYIASCFPEPERAVFGLHELLMNAIEHGNLGITYEEKTELVLAGQWLQEVERRLDSPDYRERKGGLSFMATPEAVTVTIKDEGEGFDWERYLELSPERATDPNGRGIAATRMSSFDCIEYLGCGNEVRCTIFIKDAVQGKAECADMQ
jgi:CheY-like chemotaxis protein